MWLAYHRQWRVQPAETSDGEPWASSEELQILPTRWRVEPGHALDQGTDGPALSIESMVCLDRLVQRFDRPVFLAITEEQD